MKVFGVPALLSFNGGFVDTAGFLGLQGLFTAHVTGNFVTLGAALVLGTSGTVSKLLALPMFCLMVIVTRLLTVALSATKLPLLRIVLGVNVALLAVGGALAVLLGPFDNGDSGSALVTGMTLVSAMAVQNASHRILMSTAPPSTIMTGTTTQIMLDLAEMLHGVRPEVAALTRARLRRLTLSVTVLAGGCGLAEQQRVLASSPFLGVAMRERKHRLDRGEGEGALGLQTIEGARIGEGL